MNNGNFLFSHFSTLQEREYHSISRNNLTLVHYRKESITASQGTISLQYIIGERVSQHLKEQSHFSTLQERQYHSISRNNLTLVHYRRESITASQGTISLQIIIGERVLTLVHYRRESTHFSTLQEREYSLQYIIGERVSQHLKEQSHFSTLQEREYHSISKNNLTLVHYWRESTTASQGTISLQYIIGERVLTLVHYKRKSITASQGIISLQYIIGERVSQHLKE